MVIFFSCLVNLTISSTWGKKRSLADYFDAVADGQIWLTPDSDSIRAAHDALNGWDPTYGCVYYYNPATATNQWIWSREVRLTIGAHAFAV